jgi:hypothetical protein
VIRLLGFWSRIEAENMQDSKFQLVLVFQVALRQMLEELAMGERQTAK